jgi:HAD superfamily hydrolase (TIGR01484 family)
MRYVALASDYDGTLAHDGVVDEATVQALERLVNSGRKLILVTGRELPELESVFPRLDLCELVVAENGGILFNPASKEVRVLAKRPPDSFIDSLRERGVTNMSVGDVVIATWRPFEREVLEAIRDAGLELQVIFNKEAVMILPSGVNKMTGLCAALDQLHFSRHNVVGVGDAENDHAFLESCELSVAVSNAITALKEQADYTTSAARGAGVAELIEKLIENDGQDLVPKHIRQTILVGKSGDKEVVLPAYGRNVLVCGQSGSGKSTMVTGLLERIMMSGYQICLIDPEGDYENLPGCRTVGDEKRPPTVEHVKQVLQDQSSQVIVNLVAVPATDRPVYFATLVSQLQSLRLESGRPHWLVIDEAHHVLPCEWSLTPSEIPEELSNLMLVTVHPEHVSPVALKRINSMIVVGREPLKLVKQFAEAIETPLPEGDGADLPRGHALFWDIAHQDFIRLQAEPARTEHMRHRRKYAEGRLEDERHFYFRGPNSKMNLRAHNLNTFVQIAEGIDSETWQFHLRRGDYSKWLRSSIKDSELADTVAATETDQNLPEPESRKQITAAILQKYTVPA